MARHKNPAISPEDRAAGIDTTPRSSSAQLVSRPALSATPNSQPQGSIAANTKKARDDNKNATANANNMSTPSAAVDQPRRTRNSDAGSRPSTAGGTAETASAQPPGAAAVDSAADTIAVNTQTQPAPSARRISPAARNFFLTRGKPGKEPALDSRRSGPFGDGVEGNPDPVKPRLSPSQPQVKTQSQDDKVDEGSVDYSEVRSEEFNDPYDVANDPDAQSHVSIDSDDAKQTVEQEMTVDLLSQKPWRVAGFSREARRELERMYCQLEMRAIAGDFANTELYQGEKDKEMLRYMQDFPLDQWVIPRAEAEHAYLRVLERTRWRTLGIPIYGSQRIPEMIPHSTPGFRANGSQPQQLPPNRRQAARPGSVPQQQTAYPPPQQMLRSQPHAQPMNVQPGQLYTYNGPPVAPGQIPPGLPPPPPGMMYAPTTFYPQGQYPQHPAQGPAPGATPLAPTPEASKPGKKKNQTPQPAADEQFEEDITPPYQPAPRPAARKLANKNGRANARKPAEAVTLPWHRMMDFNKAKAEARWDESFYDQNVMNSMATTRRHNMQIMHKLDDELGEKQRQQRARRQAAKKGQTPSSDAEGSRAGSVKPGHRDNVGGDPYHSGNFAFATAADVARAAHIGKHSPDDIIDAAEAGELDWDLCKQIMICWNPGKKGTTQDLKQGAFRIYDTLVTRRQLTDRPFLTRRAAECIIDFCPDLLWRETLLRIVSEGGMGNKDVRDRFCLNGCHCDKATITKRIAAAIGQKQKASPRRATGGESSSPAPERYLDGEAEWHTTNQKQYYNYINWCGTRHGTSVKVVNAGMKRGSEGLDSPGAGAAKRARNGYEDDSTDSSGDTTEDESSEEVEQEKDDDAVSIQSDTLLDEMED